MAKITREVMQFKKFIEIYINILNSKTINAIVQKKVTCNIFKLHKFVSKKTQIPTYGLFTVIDHKIISYFLVFHN